MKKPWHRRNPTLFARLKEDVQREFPDLRVVEENDVVFLRGTFPLICDGRIVDRYQIEVRFPPDYPDSIAILRETGGQIPWTTERHVNPNGEACPVVPEEWLLRTDHDSVISYLKGPVHHFFLGQSLVEYGQSWPFGERSHGLDGLFEAYGEMIGTTDRVAIRRYLEYMSKERIKGHWTCPCGSGKRLRNCHLNEVRALQERIPATVAKQALTRLEQQARPVRK